MEQQLAWVVKDLGLITDSLHISFFIFTITKKNEWAWFWSYRLLSNSWLEWSKISAPILDLWMKWADWILKNQKTIESFFVISIMEQQLAWVVKDLGPDRWPVTEMATVTNVNATAYFLIPEHNEDRARPNFQAGLCCKNVTGVERGGSGAAFGGGVQWRRRV